jgi:hypothetical protein
MIRYISYITISVFLFLACTQAGPCEGSLVLENPIPDTTVAVGDTLFIDLTDPPVFVSSEGEVTYFYSIVSGVSYVNPSIITEHNNGSKSDYLQIIGRVLGDSIVELQASSDCLENSQLLTINVIEK